jgi:hypothetical protein
MKQVREALTEVLEKLGPIILALIVRTRIGASNDKGCGCGYSRTGRMRHRESLRVRMPSLAFEPPTPSGTTGTNTT